MVGLKNLAYGVAESDIDRVASESFTGPKPRFMFDRMLERALGVSLPDLVDMANDRRFLGGIVPSGNVIGTAHDICSFFELLRQGGTIDGQEIFAPETIRRAVTRQNPFGFDAILGLPLKYGLGFMLGGRFLSFFGRNTPAAFGHLGFTNVLAWADPERQMSVAFLNNGKPFVTPELLAWLEIPRAISRCVPRR